MEKKRISRGLKKYIRKEKARIRREVFDLEEQRKLINELYKKFKRDINTGTHTNNTDKN